MFVSAASLVFALPQPPLLLEQAGWIGAESCRQISSCSRPLDRGIKWFGHFALQFDGAGGIGEGGGHSGSDCCCKTGGKRGRVSTGGWVVAPLHLPAVQRGAALCSSPPRAGSRRWPQNGAWTAPAHLCCCSPASPPAGRLPAFPPLKQPPTPRWPCSSAQPSQGLASSPPPKSKPDAGDGGIAGSTCRTEQAGPALWSKLSLWCCCPGHRWGVRSPVDPIPGTFMAPQGTLRPPCPGAAWSVFCCIRRAPDCGGCWDPSSHPPEPPDPAGPQLPGSPCHPPPGAEQGQRRCVEHSGRWLPAPAGTRGTSIQTPVKPRRATALLKIA